MIPGLGPCTCCGSGQIKKKWFWNNSQIWAPSPITALLVQQAGKAKDVHSLQGAACVDLTQFTLAPYPGGAYSGQSCCCCCCCWLVGQGGGRRAPSSQTAHGGPGKAKTQPGIITPKAWVLSSQCWQAANTPLFRALGMLSLSSVAFAKLLNFFEAWPPHL